MSTLVIRNLTPLRAIDAASASPAEILRLLGTAASDFSSGAYDGAQYLIANLSPLYSYDAASVDWAQLLRVLATLLTRNPGVTLRAYGFFVANPATQYELDAASASLAEAARLLYTLMQLAGGVNAGVPAFRVMAQQAFIPGGRQHGHFLPGAVQSATCPMCGQIVENV